MKTIEWHQMAEIMREFPHNNFVVFTHVNRKRFWEPDYLIRKWLARVPRYRRRGITIDTTFSHCGTAWYDEEEDVINYWHQTYPYFTKEPLRPRAYNVIYMVDNEETVKYARLVCEKLYKKKKGYAIGTLITFAFTLWFTWLSNPINAGKVCSQAVAYSYPTISPGNPIDSDPQKVEYNFRDRIPEQFRFVVDRRN